MYTNAYQITRMYTIVYLLLRSVVSNGGMAYGVIARRCDKAMTRMDVSAPDRRMSSFPMAKNQIGSQKHSKGSEAQRKGPTDEVGPREEEKKEEERFSYEILRKSLQLAFVRR